MVEVRSFMLLYAVNIGVCMSSTEVLHTPMQVCLYCRYNRRLYAFRRLPSTGSTSSERSRTRRGDPDERDDECQPAFNICRLYMTFADTLKSL